MMGNALRAWRQTLVALVARRRIWAPFLVTATIEALFLLILWLAPHEPFSRILAPPIRTFTSDRVLHYPWHLWFMYHAMKHTHVVAMILVGAFMSGVVCRMVQQQHQGQPMSMRQALVGGKIRYGRVVIVWLLSWGLAKAAVEVLPKVLPDTAWATWTVFGIVVLVQALLLYAIPAAVYDNLSWWRSLLKSIQESVRRPLGTLLVVAAPTAMVLGLAVVLPEGRVAKLMMETMPESAVGFILLRLIVWTVADLLMTVASAHLWWFNRGSALQTRPARARVTPAPLPKGPAVA